MNAIALPYVLKYNSSSPVVHDKLAGLSQAIGANSFIAAIQKMNILLHIPRSFAQAGITKEQFFSDFDELVENSLKGSTRANPVAVSAEDMAILLTRMYEGSDLSD
ncbi:iron-containing alcohol dehydrogenase [bacterium BFN5]|nr:iron-containing alcohol dehydrogenase [bacterium BFN5]